MGGGATRERGRPARMLLGTSLCDAGPSGRGKQLRGPDLFETKEKRVIHEGPRGPDLFETKEKRVIHEGPLRR